MVAAPKWVDNRCVVQATAHVVTMNGAIVSLPEGRLAATPKAKATSENNAIVTVTLRAAVPDTSFPGVRVSQ